MRCAILYIYLKLNPNITIIMNPIVSAKHFLSENFGNRILIAGSTVS